MALISRNKGCPQTAFGTEMSGRRLLSAKAKYGFNGMLKDNEDYGEGNAYDFGSRIYDSRLGRWLSIDPHASKYVAISPYAFALNSPLMFKDIDGNDAVVTVQKDPNGGGKIIISSTIYITGEGANAFNAREFTNQAAKTYKPGIYVNEKGEKFDVVFDVKFEYAENIAKIKMQDGDNVLEYNKNDNIISNVPSQSHTSIMTNNKTGEVVSKLTTKTTGNKGEIAKSDNIGKSFKATLHEALHLLGLSDRYSEGKSADGSRETTPNPGFEGDIMGTSSMPGVNQAHYNNYGQEYSTKDAGKYILKNRVDIDPKNGNVKGEAIKEEK